MQVESLMTATLLGLSFAVLIIFFLKYKQMAEFFKKTNTRFRPLDPQFSQTLTEMQTYDLEDKISVLQACMGRDITVLISCSRHLMQIDGVYKEGVEDLDKITEKNKSIG